MVLFTVLPGQSFHSVEEVYNPNKMRLSISGWYHSPELHPMYSIASLNQLQSKSNESLGFVEYAETFGEDKLKNEVTKGFDEIELNDKEKEHLKTFINPVYLEPSSWPQIRSHFQINEDMKDVKRENDDIESILLHSFLNPTLLRRVVEDCSKVDILEQLGNDNYPQSYTLGYTVDRIQNRFSKENDKKDDMDKHSEKKQGDNEDDCCWMPIGPPHKQRYLKFDALDLEENNMISSRALNTISSKDFSQSLKRKQLSQKLLQDIGTRLKKIKDQLFASSAFRKLIYIYTGYFPQQVRGEVRRFRPGLDYTVAHYGILTSQAMIDASLCVLNDCNVMLTASTSSKVGNIDVDYEFDYENANEVEEIWQSGDIGGFECYIKAEEGNDGVEAAESYRAKEKRKAPKTQYNGQSKNKTHMNESEIEKDNEDSMDYDGGKKETEGESANDEDEEEDSNDVMSVFATHNALSLVVRKPGYMKFLKYVSSSAPGSRWDIACEYKI